MGMVARGAREIVGLGEVIQIAALETELPMIEAYAGLTSGDS